MPDKALEALKQACSNQIAWLRKHATALEAGSNRYLVRTSDADEDRSALIAEDFHHQANNLSAIIQAYERLLLRQAPMHDPTVTKAANLTLTRKTGLGPESSP
jgi:hypothetical protein